MIPKECKRIAEVDFPIAVVSKHAAREKSIRHGHPSTLHLWWARRPLAACRAMLLGLLLPDPCDSACPKGFKDEARRLLPPVLGQVGTTDADLRRALLKFMGDFANWDNASKPSFLEVGRGLVCAAHGQETPLVVDPFAGGGSIPLEALRLGCDAFASDLNPVACLILKVMLEDIPRQGPALAEEIRRVGNEIKEAAEEELADLYPRDVDGARPMAYLWARTVRCESTGCGAEIPLVRSWWLCKKATRRRALRPRVVRSGNPPRVQLEIFEPGTEKEIPAGTVSRAKATCLACNVVLAPERVRAQLSEQRGGADVLFDHKGVRIGGAIMTAVVLLRDGEAGRHYRLPTDRDYDAARKAQERLRVILQTWKRDGSQGLCPVPDEPVTRVPVPFGVINVWVYGMHQWGDLFTARQKVALITLQRLATSRTRGAATEGIAIAIDRMADGNASLSRWLASREEIKNVFGRQALGMVWDFAEVDMKSAATRSWSGALEWILNVVGAWPGSQSAQTQSADAAAHPLPSDSAAVWFTDPPYYDSVPYSYIADYFYVWLKRTLGASSPVLFSDPLSPKAREIVAYTDSGNPDESAYEGYERKMAIAFAEGRRVLREDGLGSVVFAHKTTEGWESLLSGLIAGGWTITGSWPIATEMGSRLRARDSAALATSVHLVCRPRSENVAVGDWGHVLRELPPRVADWMDRLQAEGIRGADLVFACIGPALEIFSRYSKVETAEGREVLLAEYLEKVWEVVGRTALTQVLGGAEAQARNGAAAALEEDARLTALFLWTLQSTNGDSKQAANDAGESEAEEDNETEEDEEAPPKKKGKGLFLIHDVVRRFAQPLGINLPEWEERIIETAKGLVRLLPVAERAKQLFGKDGADVAAERLEQGARESPQLLLFPDADETPKPGRGRQRKARGSIVSDDTLRTRREATTLDRVHAAMLLQSAGRANALRALLATEQDRSPDFLRLANALSALYPKGCEEKRLLDAMLLAVPR